MTVVSGGRQVPAVTGRAGGGFVTVQFVAAVGLSLVLLTMLANLVVFQYGRGVVRAALDEGVRTASRAGAPTAECHRRAGAVLDDLLGGAMGRDVTVDCRLAGPMVVADAQVTFRGWLPTVPDWTFTATATAVREQAP